METLTPAKVAPIFVPTPDWTDTGNFYAGVILRRHGYAIECCANGSQRRGWWSEHSRKLHVAKQPKFKPVQVVADDDPDQLPY